ncbi:MAG TPA: small ribosomal subunit Rsm22 family protein [Ktedonobacterales bacterium]|nr:small ribosomal subunit Rsm22 family protein [Ktedonobacterales bacterium]
MELPEALRLAIIETAERQPHQTLERAAANLSAAYRADDGANTTHAMDSPAAVAAYAVTRLPATYAALAAALSEARARLPRWEPRALLDAGAGPGVSAWAASAVWPSLRHATLLERDQRMIALGTELLAASPPGALQVAWRQVDMAGPWGRPTPAPADLVTCAYALNELPEARRAELVARLWNATEPARGALALAAPGTPAGFAAIRAARDQLIAAGARIIAPCPHERACPMLPGDWCHMAQRLARTRLHRRLKGGDAPFEDEKFSYIVAARQAGAPIAARVIRRPLTRPGRITLDLCGPDGLTQREITRSQRLLFRLARDARWGSAWPLATSDESGAGDADMSSEGNARE